MQITLTKINSHDHLMARELSSEKSRSPLREREIDYRYGENLEVHQTEENDYEFLKDYNDLIDGGIPD